MTSRTSLIMSGSSAEMGSWKRYFETVQLLLDVAPPTPKFRTPMSPSRH